MRFVQSESLVTAAERARERSFHGGSARAFPVSGRGFAADGRPGAHSVPSYVLGMFLLVITIVLLALSSPASARDATVVVHRGDSAVELYFSLPAPSLVSVFGLPPERLEQADGTVDFEPLRLGTWEIGDAAFEGVDARIGGAPAVFEAMSLMVHPANAKLPLRDPVEGMIAISVCTVPQPEMPPSLDELHAYTGYIAYTDAPQGPVLLRLPETGRRTLEVTVLDFTDHRLTGRSEHVVMDGGTLVMAPGQGTIARPELFILAAGLVAAVGLLIAAGYRGRHGSAVRP